MKKLFIMLTAMLFAVTAMAQTPEQLLGQLKQRLAPDKRTALWDVAATMKDNTVVLSGTVSTSELKAELDKAFEGQKVVNNVKALDMSQPADHRWALVKVAVATMRCDAKNSAEMATQAIMGTPVKVLDNNGEWYRVQMPDDYIAYVPGDLLSFRSQAQMQQWRNTGRSIVTVHSSRLVEAPGSDAAVTDLVLGDILETRGVQGEWVELVTPDGRAGWVISDNVDDLAHWKQQPLDIPLVERTARSMMGSGYLWGGTSTKMSDCSGLIKVSYLSSGVILQRDASQQALTGKKIGNWHDCQLGDLLFFGNSTSGRVTHVGMYLRDGKYIHCTGATGMVCISSLDPNSPDYLFSPLSISRISGQVGTKGITSVAAHPWY